MKARIALALISSLFLGACVADSATEDDSAEATPRLASNSMLPGVISSSNLNAAPISGPALTASGLEANASGRSYIGYMMECALNSRTTLTSAFGGVIYSYPGSLGLAQAWGTRALTTSEARYVSACVLSRANVFGQPVTISMRADNSILATTSDELANYNVEEAAYWGNVFSSNPGQMHACNGVDQVRDGDTYGDLPLRQCAQPDPNNPGYTLCGFVFDGNCADICVRNGDHYTSCGTQTEVITTLLYGTAP
jgi:hypothetical protein